MAAGTVDTDAVNVSQLKAVNNALTKGQTHYYSVNDGGTVGANYNNDGAGGSRCQHHDARRHCDW